MFTPIGSPQKTREDWNKVPRWQTVQLTQLHIFNHVTANIYWALICERHYPKSFRCINFLNVHLTDKNREAQRLIYPRSHTICSLNQYLDLNSGSVLALLTNTCLMLENVALKYEKIQRLQMFSSLVTNVESVISSSITNCHSIILGFFPSSVSHIREHLRI